MWILLTLKLLLFFGMVMAKSFYLSSYSSHTKSKIGIDVETKNIKSLIDESKGGRHG
jgi:hypothetical protein